MPPAWALAARVRFAAEAVFFTEGRRAAPSETNVAANWSGAGLRRRSALVLDFVVSRNSSSLSRALLERETGLAAVAGFLSGDLAVGLAALRARARSPTSSSKPVSKGLRLRRPVSTRKALKCFWMSYAAMQTSCAAQLTTRAQRVVVGGLSRGLPSAAGLSVVDAPGSACLLASGTVRACVRARVRGEVVASSGRGTVGSGGGIYQWMDGGAVLANGYWSGLSTGGRRFVGAICVWSRADGRAASRVQCSERRWKGETKDQSSKLLLSIAFLHRLDIMRCVAMAPAPSWQNSTVSNSVRRCIDVS